MKILQSKCLPNKGYGEHYKFLILFPHSTEQPTNIKKVVLRWVEFGIFRLAKAGGNGYLKGEPRNLREQEPGLARRVTAPRTVASTGFNF